MDYSIQKEKTIILKTSRKVIQLSVENILYVECDSYIISYYLINQKKPEVISSTLKKVEEELINFNFLRINRSQIINMKYFKSFDIKEKKITLRNGLNFPISRRKLADLKNYV